jgi:hypothetical protein
MPKIFYTEYDIELLAAQGVLTLDVNDDVVLTDLAYERASRLGVKLLKPNETPPSAPVRPYVAKESQQKTVSQAGETPKSSGDLKQRVRDAVIARLGSQVDPVLLDTIIQRVLNNVGVK